MSDETRQRRLHVQNRLEELRAKYGRDLEEEAMPDWLDHYPTREERQIKVNGTKAPIPPVVPTAPEMFGMDIPG